MTGMIHGLSCFPCISNKFITWGSGINLYELEIRRQLTDLPETKNSNTLVDISSKTIANFLISEDKYQYIRCVKPSYYDDKPMVAVGMSNGKVGICDFINSPGCDNNNNEFVPRQQRTCLCLAWNEYDKNILAIGHDKNRSDYCITIWDIKRGNNKDAFTYMGLSETANSLCWDKQNRILITGMSQKSIRQFDLRQSNTSTTSIVNTRLVNGLTLSPSGQYVASYVDQIIGLWDLRNIDRPLTQIQIQKNITNISWSPTRSCVLSAVQRGSPYLHVIDIYNVDVDNGHELYFSKKNFIPLNAKNISYLSNTTGSGNNVNKMNTIADISWHPNSIDRALILMESGNITDFQIPPRIAITWASNDSLWHSIKLYLTTPTIFNNTKLSNLNENITNLEQNCNLYDDIQSSQTITIFEDEDIAQVMKKRALADYGLIADIRKNGELAQNNRLKAFWRMLANMVDDDGITGLKSVLGIDVIPSPENYFPVRSEVQTLSWPEFIKNSNILNSYRNETRTKAQLLCGWDFENDMNVFRTKFIPSLCAKKEYTRAAMIAVFYLKINQACEILLSGTSDTTSDPSILRMAAIALSGFDSDHSSLVWKQKQALASSQIRDPYLRIIFSFLTIENENFDIILYEKGISLPDRIAFACKYLSDIKLTEFIKLTIQKCIQDGDLNGLLLTGESNDSINIMQSYMDTYQDIQTISLLVIRFFHINELCVEYWISSYLDLLDEWGLWEKRAELENKMSFRNVTSASITKSSRLVFLLCNFCGKSVSAALTEDARKRNVSSNVNKLSSCPNCRKPLPRCSLCILHMGTTTGFLSQITPDHESLGWQSKPFSKWFSWCQTCRHGGHTEHLQQWFQKNTECPVTGCSCKCFEMDLSVPKFTKEVM